MVRIISFAFAATSSLLLLASATTGHAAQSNDYAAKPLKAPTKSSFIVRDRMWKCDDAGTCWGPKSTGSATTACTLAARRLGELSAFHVAGQPVDAATLAACNSKAG